MPRSSGERKISEKWRGSRKKLVLRWPWEEMMICMGTGETRRHPGKKSHVDEGSETGIGAVWLWDQEGIREQVTGAQVITGMGLLGGGMASVRSASFCSQPGDSRLISESSALGEG